MTQLRPTLDKAGRFPVAQIPCPFQHSQLVDLSAPPAGILHTTEGGWPGSMAVFKQHFAPHFLVGLNANGRAEIAQLVPVGFIGLACRAHNNKARVEVEMVGNAKEALWQPDPETLDALASLMMVCRKEYDIPLSHPWPVGDYGRAGKNAHRSSGKYGTVAGWFGHADMPDPDTHWDPGNLNWPLIFARAVEINNGVAVASVAPPVHGPSWLQASLNRLGADPKLAIDGDLGPRTKAALYAWQFKAELKPTGKDDPETVAAIERALAAVSA